MAKKTKKPAVPVLPVEKEVIFRVSYSDLEDFFCEVYDFKSWSFVADQECGNDSDHTFDVDGKLGKLDREELVEILKSKKQTQFRTELLLKDCCARGLIEPGQYLVAVCW